LACLDELKSQRPKGREKKTKYCQGGINHKKQRGGQTHPGYEVVEKKEMLLLHDKMSPPTGVGSKEVRWLSDLNLNLKTAWSVWGNCQQEKEGEKVRRTFH